MTKEEFLISYCPHYKDWSRIYDSYHQYLNNMSNDIGDVCTTEDILVAIETNICSELIEPLCEICFNEDVFMNYEDELYETLDDGWSFIEVHDNHIYVFLDVFVESVNDITNNKVYLQQTDIVLIEHDLNAKVPYKCIVL